VSYETLSEHEWDAVDQVWVRLADGDRERARAEADELLRQRPRHPDLLILDAAVALEEGHPDRALEALQGAQRSADPALLFHLRAAANFELVQLDAARDDAERALAVRNDAPETHDLLARTLELLGNDQRADEHFELAHELDPEAHPLPLDVDDDEFDRLVEQSLEELPAEVRRHLDEIPVMVEALPQPRILCAERPPLAPDILGLFVGRHLMDRTHDQLPDAPGAIYLFRRNLLRACADREELAKEIRITVQHEVGHLLGLDEDDLERWGLA
jgi:predicted Zn-dependent protease with MMP-like domain